MAVMQVDGVEADVFDQAEVTALVTLLLNAEICLYQSTFAPSKASVHADFAAAVATFTGYANDVVTWSPMAVGADGNAVTVSSRAFFQATDGVTPNTIGGAWLETTGAEVVDYFPFAVPIPMANALDFIAVTVSIGHREGASAVVEN